MRPVRGSLPVRNLLAQRKMHSISPRYKLELFVQYWKIRFPMSNMAFKAKQSLTASNDSVHCPHQGMLSCPQSASHVQHVQYIAKLFSIFNSCNTAK